MKKLLVPLDFSKTSLDALFFATKIFGDSSVEITLLNVYGTQSTALMMKSIDSILIKDAEENMSKVIKEVQEKAPHVQLKKKLVKNYAESTIISMGDSGFYDCIVMGTKGASGLKEVFIGSVAGSVISKTSAPVIVVPPNYANGSLKSVIFAVSDQPITNPNTIGPLKAIIKENDAKLEVLHIADKEPTDLDDTLQQIKDLNPSITYSFGTGNTHDDLNEHIKNNKADLLCLISTKKGFFERLLDGSVTLQQTFSSTVPLLILPG